MQVGIDISGAQVRHLHISFAEAASMTNFEQEPYEVLVPEAVKSTSYASEAAISRARYANSDRNRSKPNRKSPGKGSAAPPPAPPLQSRFGDFTQQSTS